MIERVVSEQSEGSQFLVPAFLKPVPRRSSKACGALLAGCSVVLLAGCVQPYVPSYGAYPHSSSPTLATQDETANVEEQDRIARFRRLASMQGVVQPEVERLLLPPGSTSSMSGPVPVVRVVFPERAFFAFDSAVPLAASGPILDVIAEDMKRDVPDAAMTVLGHTDAVGTNGYNIDLSRRRAAAVISALVARGVNPQQLSAVAIGKRQPIAPNDTADGRALNRRVEFLVSPGLSANLAAVQQRVVPAGLFQMRPPELIQRRQAADIEARQHTGDVQPRTASDSSVTPVPLATSQSATTSPFDPNPVPRVPDEVLPRVPSVAEVFRPATGASARGPAALQAVGGLELSPVAPLPTGRDAVVAAPRAEPVSLAPTMPVAPVRLIPPDQIQPRALNPDGPVKY